VGIPTIRGVEERILSLAQSPMVLEREAAPVVRPTSWPAGSVTGPMMSRDGTFR
jgi:hypothetical protein